MVKILAHIENEKLVVGHGRPDIGSRMPYGVLVSCGASQVSSGLRRWHRRLYNHRIPKSPPSSQLIHVKPPTPKTTHRSAGPRINRRVLWEPRSKNNRWSFLLDHVPVSTFKLQALKTTIFVFFYIFYFSNFVVQGLGSPAFFHSLNKIVMNFQPTGCNQMPKGFKAKQALQLALLLGVCFWLLCQIERLNSKGKDYGGGLQSKLSEQHAGIVLGRKGNAGWSSDGGVSNLEDVNLVGEDKKKEDGGGGDDELDGIVEEQFSHEELERQYMVSLNDEENNSDVEVIRKDEAVGSYKHSVEGVNSKKGYDDSWGSSEQVGEKRLEIPKTEVKQVDEEDLERQGKEPEKIKEIANDSIKQYQDEAASLNRENEEDEGITGSKQKIAVQPSGVENNGTVVGRSEMLDGIHGFHDENGVPQDGNDLVETIVSGSMGDQANILHQDT